MSIFSDTFSISGSRIGDGNKVYVIAEIGSNHNGDLSLAKEHIQAAAEAGVDAAKFQAFRAEEHYSKFTPEFSYLEDEGGQSPDTYKLIESLEINREWHGELIEYCSDQGIDFLSSPCDRSAVDQLDELGMPAFKVASFDITDVGLIGYIAEQGKPVILSTGLADYFDIQSALRAALGADNPDVALLQCTSVYPAPPELANIRAVQTMREAFDVITGYSDHTLGDHVSLGAIALGASVVEKHFTLDRTMEGPDHEFAIEPDELARMMDRIRDLESALGDGVKDGASEREQEMANKGRRSLHVAVDKAAGEPLHEEDLIVKRPGLGIHPEMKQAVVGMILQKPVPADHWLSWSAFKMDDEAKRREN